MSQIDLSPPDPSPLPGGRRSRAAPRRAAPLAAEGGAAALQGQLQARTDELAATLALVRATLESTADAVLATDDEGRVTAWNEKFLQLWQFRAGQVEGATHAGLVQLAADRLVRPAAVARRVRDIQSARRETENTDLVELRDGRVLERFSCAQRIGGRMVGRVWSYRDITSRLLAEDALRDEAGVLHFLNRTGAAIAAELDIVPLLQTVIDSATQVSGAAFGAFLYREPPADDEAPARPLLALAGVAQATAGDPASTAALFDAVWSGDRIVRCADITELERYATTSAWFGLADGFSPLRSFLAVPVTLRSGVIAGALFFGHPEAGVFSERTERIVAGLAVHASIALHNSQLVEGMRRVAQEREQLALAERQARAEAAGATHMKDEFLSTLSHELRTPLTAILGWSKVLLLQRSDAPTQQRGLEAIARNASAQAALIDDLLDMSRIVSGKVKLDMQSADLARVVDAALAGVRGAADAKHIALERRIDRTACRVHGDAARLQQVVENLLSNAVKFTPAHGRVEVSVVEAGGHVEIAVEDTGMGIAPEFVPHVFEQFRQADSSTTRRHGGLGLGLAIVKQLVGMHGGAVSARSAGRGHGARFVVRLPCHERAATPEAARAQPATEAPGAFAEVDLHGLRLLVVDDDDDARELIAQVLVECGAQVCQAASAADALREFERQPPDVLLSDVGMPERDGYELIRDIRALDAARGGRVPAMAVTAFARPEDRARAMLAGFQAHVAKPVRPGELVSTVAGLAPRQGAA